MRTSVPVFFFYLISISWLISPVSAQDLHAYVDSDSVRVGDIIHLTYVFDRTEEIESVQFPGEEVFDPNEFQFVDRERFRISAMRDSVVYRLQFFGIQDTEIEGQTIIAIDSEGQSQTFNSAPVPLFFKSMVSEEDEAFRPLKPIFDFAGSLWPWLLALLLFGLAGWYFYQRFRHTEPEPPVSPPPPKEPIPFTDPRDTLRMELDALSGESSPLKQEDFKEFYIRLGDAIRLYFEQAYKIAALEMTSGEILRSLRDYPAEKEVIVSTRKVLNEADMVKFARFEPDLSQAEHSLQIAYRFHDVVSTVDKNRIERLKEAYEQKQIAELETDHHELG